MYHTKKMQVFFDITMSDKKTYTGQSELIELAIADVPGHFGFWNELGLNMIGALIVACLSVGIIIATIILAATRACRRCRYEEEVFVFDPEAKALADSYIG